MGLIKGHLDVVLAGPMFHKHGHIEQEEGRGNTVSGVCVSVSGFDLASSPRLLVLTVKIKVSMRNKAWVQPLAPSATPHRLTFALKDSKRERQSIRCNETEAAQTRAVVNRQITNKAPPPSSPPPSPSISRQVKLTDLRCWCRNAIHLLHA